MQRLNVEPALAAALRSKLREPSLLATQAFIGGNWTDAHDKATFDVNDPATGDALASVPDMYAIDTQHAIDAANQALKKPAWRKSLAKERATILHKICALHREHADDLATIMTLECGKPFAEARGEIEYSAGYFEWFAEEARRLDGSIIPANAHGRRLMVLRQPVGVCGLITPWNFPSAMLARKLSAAIAAGCTTVAKPAADTPLSALALARICEMAGLPSGVFNIVTTSGANAPAFGDVITGSSDVRKVSFTGSTAVGKMLLKQSADTVKRVSMELGGNAPFIVCEDADLDAAVIGAMQSKFRNAGQTCVSANRMLIHSSIYDSFCTKLCAAVERDVKLGHGMESGVTQGPLINSQGLAKVKKMVASAIEQGATIAGSSANGAHGEGCSAAKLGGLFHDAIVLRDVQPSMSVVSDEIFGPVASLIRFENDDEALQLANDTNAGLAAYVYTKDLSRSFRFSEELEYGMVGVNTGLISTEVAPFGGVKESGLGREGSSFGLDDYTELKYVAMGVDC